jgi:hypothetical protein
MPKQPSTGVASGESSLTPKTPGQGSGGASSSGGAKVADAGWEFVPTESSSRATGSWLEGAPTRGAGPVGGEAWTATILALGGAAAS